MILPQKFYSREYLEHTANNTCSLYAQSEVKTTQDSREVMCELPVWRRSTDSGEWRSKVYYTQTLLTSAATWSYFK